MRFDFFTFSRRVRDIYSRCETRFSVEEVLAVFHSFFEAYEKYRGEVHPMPSTRLVVGIINRLDFCEDGSGRRCDILELFPDDYEALIPAYFETDFHPGCNYRIGHFFSGTIRALRFYEELF